MGARLALQNGSLRATAAAEVKSGQAESATVLNGLSSALARPCP